MTGEESDGEAPPLPPPAFLPQPPTPASEEEHVCEAEAGGMPDGSSRDLMVDPLATVLPPVGQIHGERFAGVAGDSDSYSVASDGSWSEYFVPPSILGCDVRRDFHSGKYREFVSSALCAKDCSKYKSLKHLVPQLGRSAAADFLHAWLAAGVGFDDDSDPSHRQYQPSLREIRENRCP